MRDDSMMDPLDREIAEALAVDPSPEFVARVRQRIVAESERQAGRWRWIAASGAALATAAAIALVVMSREIQHPAIPLASRASSGGVALPAVAGADLRVGPERRGGHIGPALRRAEPDILIDAREATALRALYLGASAGRVDVRQLQDLATQAAAPPQKPDQIVVTPIAVEPIAPETGGGERQ